MILLLFGVAGCTNPTPPEGGGITSSTTFSTVSTSMRFTTTSTLTTLNREEAVLCARKNAMSNDTIIYVYTLKCCNESVNPSVSSVETKGYKFKKIEADKLNTVTEPLLKCYLPPGMITVPQLICAGTGEAKVIVRQGAVLEQITAFSEKCVKSASSI
jgi:hypothetical protein